MHVAGLGGARDDGRHAGRGGEARGHELRRHAAGAKGGAGGRDVDGEARGVGDDLDGQRIGVGAWVGGVEAVDVGHEEEVISVYHGGSDG